MILRRADVVGAGTRQLHPQQVEEPAVSPFDHPGDLKVLTVGDVRSSNVHTRGTAASCFREDFARRRDVVVDFRRFYCAPSVTVLRSALVIDSRIIISFRNELLHFR